MTALTQLFNNTSADTPNDPLQKSLIDLWSKIEKKQQRIQKFLKEKENLYVEFQTKVLPLEQQQGMELINLVEFLIPFLTRKSLSSYQREELINWIENTLEYLRSHPFLTDVDHGALHNKFNAAFASFMQSQDLAVEDQHIEKMRLEIEHMFGGDMQLTDDEIVALLKDPSILNQYIKRMKENLEIKDDEEQGQEQNSAHSEQHDNPFENFFENDFHADDTQHPGSQGAKQKDLDKLFKAGQLNKIYKRLASLLHPDKEQDPAKKEQMHVLMQTLSEARKNKDAFTLLQMYQQHINDGEFGFDSDTLSSMYALLKEKLYLLDDELYHAKSNNELSTLVWRRFSGKSKKQTENNFKTHISNLEDEVYENQLIMQQNQTVAQMKKLLQEKVEENRGWVSDMPIDLLDLFR